MAGRNESDLWATGYVLRPGFHMDHREDEHMVPVTRINPRAAPWGSMEINSHGPSSRLRSEPFIAQGPRRFHEKKNIKRLLSRSQMNCTQRLGSGVLPRPTPLGLPIVSVSSADWVHTGESSANIPHPCVHLVVQPGILVTDHRYGYSKSTLARVYLCRLLVVPVFPAEDK